MNHLPSNKRVSKTEHTPPNLLVIDTYNPIINSGCHLVNDNIAHCKHQIASQCHHCQKLCPIQPKQQQQFRNIEFLGYLSRNEIQQLLRKTKAVVVTSQWYETFGMIVVEAFASGVPVIVGDIGSVGSLVDNRVNGIKFKYDSCESLICAIEEFETLDRDVLRENAYRKYKKYFNQDRNYEMIQEIYDEIQDTQSLLTRQS